MDAHRIERISEDVITQYGLPLGLVAVRTDGLHWRVIVRDHSRRAIEITLPGDITTGALRNLLKERLEAAC
jgi:hypothetical protein